MQLRKIRSLNLASLAQMFFGRSWPRFLNMSFRQQVGKSKRAFTNKRPVSYDSNDRSQIVAPPFSLEPPVWLRFPPFC
jgi:hypothetical protein